MFQNNYSVGSCIPVNYNIGASVQENNKSKFVVADTTKKEMILVENIFKWDRMVNENHPNFSIVPNGIITSNIGKTKIHSEAIATGAFEVVKKHKVFNPDGSYNANKSYLEVIFYIKEREPFSRYFRISEVIDDKAISKFLTNNCIFFEKKNAGILANHFRLSGHKLKEEKENIGIDSNLENADYIPSSDEIAEKFRLFPDTSDEELVDIITPISICCISKSISMWSNEVFNEIPCVVYINPDYNVTTEEISEIHKTQVKVFSKNTTMNDILNTVDDSVVISTEALSPYMHKALVQQLGVFLAENNGNIWSLPVILDTKPDIYEGVRNILTIPYKMLEIYDVPDVGAWFRNVLSKEREKLLKYYKYCLNLLIEEGYIGTTLCNFVASIEATACLILEKNLFNSSKKSSVLQKLHQCLLMYAHHEWNNCVNDFISYIYNPSLPVLHIKKAYGRDKIPTIIVDEDKVYFDKATLGKIAVDIRASFEGLRNSLKENGLLIHNKTNSYQRNKNINDNISEAFYTIKQSKIFLPGEVHLHADNFAECRPDIMIPIGHCGNDKIYFAINSLAEILNNHLSVLGNSGSGKTYFIAELVKKAAEEGIDTYIVGKTDAEISYLNDDLYKKIIIRQGEEIEIADEESGKGKIFAFYVDGDVDDGCNNVLSDLWEKLSKRKYLKPVFIVVDEAHEIDLSQGSVFVKKFLKQGRSFGIIVVMSTQATNSDIAKNLTSVMTQFTTSFEFRTSDSNKSMRNLRIDSAEEGYRIIKKELLTLDVGTCYAKGNLATDKDFIRYPVKLHIESNNSERR